MFKFEFQRKILIGHGKTHVGYAIERWWCLLGFTLVHLQSVGIRGIVPNPEEDQTSVRGISTDESH